MRKTAAAVAFAASMTVGGLAGATLGVPGVAGAAEAAAGWVDEALGGLVDDGTITQAQADAVETALEEARPARAHRALRHHGLDAAADALAMTEEDVRDALADGKTLAEVAGEQGISVDALVDALVAEHQARLDEAVAEGDLTQEQADERLAAAEERVTAFVNGERPERPERPAGLGGGRRGPGRWAA